jgi:spore coat protein CotH
MGTDVSVLYDLVTNDYRPVHDIEGTERPLVRRMMALDGQRAAYLARYRELSGTLLTASYLDDRLDALTAIVEPSISTTDHQRLMSENDSVRTFIMRRTAAVAAELETLDR